jgi:hypothetical protein
MVVEARKPGGSVSRWPVEFLEPGADLQLRLLHDFVGDDLVSMRDVRFALAKLRTSPQVGPNLRVAVAGGYRQDVRQQVIDSDPLHDDESLQEWAQRLFADNPFYVVVNELELFDPALARRVARLLWPIIESQAHWFGGLSLALLIGREGFTSFGIHRDRDCRWNVQFHLGPAPKSMAVWADGTLDDAPAADLLAVAPLLPQGESFRLDPGDLFVLPCQKRHAAHYTELAVTLVASMRTESERSITEAALRRLLDRSYGGEPSPPVALARSTLTDGRLSDLAIDDAGLQGAREQERLRRWSNLGMTVRESEQLPAISEVLDKTLSIVDPFPICRQALDGSRRWVAARGHVITIAGGEEIDALVERLNAGKTIAVGRDLAPATLMLLAFLLGHGAVCEADPVS